MPYQVASPPTGPMVAFDRDVYEKVLNLIRPARFHMLIRVYREAEQMGSGLYMPEKAKDFADRSNCRAQIWCMSKDCFKGPSWPSGNLLDLDCGDWILIQSYAGGRMKISEWPEEDFRIINDTEILCWISDPEKVDRNW